MWNEQIFSGMLSSDLTIGLDVNKCLKGVKLSVFYFARKIILPLIPSNEETMAEIAL